MEPMKVGEYIKAARNRANLTLSALGTIVGIAPSSLHSIENNQLKNPPSPVELVRISDALMDREMLVQYCNSCPIRSRILIRKFAALNQIVVGSLAAALKTSQKLTESSDAVQSMLGLMLKPNFAADPEYIEYRNNVIIKILDAKRGTEILIDQLIADGFLTEDDLRTLKGVQQQMCIDKGYHREGEA